MTDNEIIKAFECCFSNGNKVENFDICPLLGFYPYCDNVLNLNAFNLINRQKAEIEQLTINMNAFDLSAIREKERADTARADAIKEFAERLKDEWLAVVLLKNKSDDYAEGYHDALCYVEDQIDKLVKEMAGESNG